MKLYIKLFFIGLIALSQSVPAFAKDGKFACDDSKGCCENDTGGLHADEFWYCGPVTNKWCKNAKLNNSDRRSWYQNGGKFTFSNSTYWCCANQGEVGKWYSGSNWITKTETVTKTFTNPVGTCTWVKKTNICGKVDNPNDECMEPTPCELGLVRRQTTGKCAQPCTDGYAYSGEIDDTCIPCEATSSQGIVKDVCVKCALNEYFSKTKLACIKYSDMTQVSASAHEACWLCSTPEVMRDCLTQMSEKGTLDAKTKKACSLNGSQSTSATWVNTVSFDRAAKVPASNLFK